MDDKTVPIPRHSPRLKAKQQNSRKKWEASQFSRTLFDQTGECIFIIDLDLCYLAANRQALQLLGYEEHEIVGMPVSHVISLEEMPEHPVAAGDVPNIYERILKRKDGTLIPVEIGTSLVSDENGEPAYIQSIVRDISDRKETERLLKRNGRILAVISEATARLLRSPNIELGIFDLLESLGYTLEVFCCVIFKVENYSGSPEVKILYNWLEPGTAGFDMTATIRSFVDRILSAPEAVLTGTEADRMNGFPGYSYLAVPIEGTLGARGYLGMFDRENLMAWLPAEFDVVHTAANLIGAALQRIQYEETIRLDEFRNRTIVDAFPDLLIRIDSDGLILDYSSSPNHPLFIQRDMLAGRKLSETWPEEIVSGILGDKNREGFSDPHWQEGFQLPFSSSVYESRLHPISRDEALIIIRDISDMVHLNEMKTDFINRASHELRTPLTAAILMADLIQQGGTPEELQEYWGVLRNELNRQKSLIDRLLMAGRLESGMVKLEGVPMDLIPVLDESLQAVKPIANKKGIVLSLEADQKPASILGDAGALQQVFINLINNAVKFSPEGSIVRVSTVLTDEHADVSIADQGMGIAPEAIAHLFEKFYRARNVTIAEIPGSGIGLYIVKSIVEELGGSIDVRSETNKGTTFIVHLKRPA